MMLRGRRKEILQGPVGYYDFGLKLRWGTIEDLSTPFYIFPFPLCLVVVE